MDIEEDDFLSELRAHVARKYITRTAAAEAWGVSVPYACAVVCGNKPPNKRILDDVGYSRTVDKIVTYRSLDNG